MPEHFLGRDCQNPHRGRPAYVGASVPCAAVEPSGSIQNTVTPDNPFCVDVDPTLPDTPCVYVVIDGVETEMVYDENTGQYSGDGGLGATYDSVLGWRFNTPNGTFSPPVATTNPIGFYVSGDNSLTVIPCSAATVDDLPDCVGVSAASGDLPVENFTYQSDTAYVGDTTGATLTYITGQWIYTGVQTLNGPFTADSTEGLYQDADGNTIVIGACNDPVEPDPIDTPNCMEATLVSDIFTESQFSKTSNTFYVSQTDVATTIEWNGTNWVYTENGIELTGPTTEGDPTGIYEGLDNADPANEVSVYLQPC